MHIILGGTGHVGSAAAATLLRHGEAVTAVTRDAGKAAHLVEQVFTIERIPALYQQARDAIQRAGAGNVSMLLGDGTLGWREYAPYDAILVSAGAPSVPEPLLNQIADRGRMLVPVGTRDDQQLVMYSRANGQLERKEIGTVRFVPLVGHHGWEDNERR